VRRVASLEALEDRVVFAVDGQDAATVTLGRGHDEFPGHDENFFAGQRDVYARLQRGDRRPKTTGADNRHQNHVGLGDCGQFAQAFFADENARRVVQERTKRGCGRFVGNGKHRRTQGIGLLGQFFRVAESGHPHDLHALGKVFGHTTGATADRTGRPEQDDAARTHDWGNPRTRRM